MHTVETTATTMHAETYQGVMEKLTDPFRELDAAILEAIQNGRRVLFGRRIRALAETLVESGGSIPALIHRRLEALRGCGLIHRLEGTVRRSPPNRSAWRIAERSSAPPFQLTSGTEAEGISDVSTPPGFDRWNPSMRSAYANGFRAGSRGDAASTNPYQDRRQGSGRLTWSRAFRKAWREGWEQGHAVSEVRGRLDSRP